jgi:hypothetical protein
MIDTRAVAQEVQDQLTAALHKGQEQIRKGRESVTVAVRTGNQIAQAVKPSLPKLPAVQVKLPSLSEIASPDKLRASAHEFASQMLAAQRKLTDQAIASQRRLAGHAQELTDQAVATQRKLGDRALEVAGPFITDGVNRLAHAAGTFVPGRRAERSDHAEPVDHTTIATPAKAESAPEAGPAPAASSAAKASPKPRATKAAGAAKTGTAKAGPKPRTTKAAGAAKTGTAKSRSTAAGKPRTTQK